LMHESVTYPSTPGALGTSKLRGCEWVHFLVLTRRFYQERPDGLWRRGETSLGLATFLANRRCGKVLLRYRSLNFRQSEPTPRLLVLLDQLN